MVQHDRGELGDGAAIEQRAVLVARRDCLKDHLAGDFEGAAVLRAGWLLQKGNGRPFHGGPTNGVRRREGWPTRRGSGSPFAGERRSGTAEGGAGRPAGGEGEGGSPPVGPPGRARSGAGKSCGHIAAPPRPQAVFAARKARI